MVSCFFRGSYRWFFPNRAEYPASVTEPQVERHTLLKVGKSQRHLYTGPKAVSPGVGGN